MASPAYEQILRVQSLDLALTQLRHRGETHPLRSEVAMAAEAAAAAEAAIGGLEENQASLERDLKRLSDEVELIEAKRADVDGKLYGGAVTASKELLALQDEAAALLARQRGLEDEELEIMEQLDTLGTELTAVRADRDRAQADERERQTALDAALGELTGEIDGVERERATVIEEAVPELLARYQQLAPQFDGVAVARFVDGRCDGCNLQLSAIAVDQLQKAPDDAVVECEECGRLLVR